MPFLPYFTHHSRAHKQADIQYHTVGDSTSCNFFSQIENNYMLNKFWKFYCSSKVNDSQWLQKIYSSETSLIMSIWIILYVRAIVSNINFKSILHNDFYITNLKWQS